MNHCPDESSKLIPLSFEFRELTPELKERAREELFEDEETKPQKLNDLRDLLTKRRIHFPDEDDFLLIFLRVAKFDVKKAATLMKNLFALIRKQGDLFNEKLDFESVYRNIELNNVNVLPYRDFDGSVILVLRAGKMKPDRIGILEILRTASIVFVQAVFSPHTQVAGMKIIADADGFGLNHLLALSWFTRFAADVFMRTSLVRFKKIHIVNENGFISTFLRIFKAFLSKKMRNRFEVHGHDINSLQSSISPSLLPEEYGGNLGPLEDTGLANAISLNEEYIQKFFSYARLSKI